LGIVASLGAVPALSVVPAVSFSVSLLAVSVEVSDVLELVLFVDSFFSSLLLEELLHAETEIIDKASNVSNAIRDFFNLSTPHELFWFSFLDKEDLKTIIFILTLSIVFMNHPL
jgi:hypothetical protein